MKRRRRLVLLHLAYRGAWVSAQALTFLWPEQIYRRIHRHREFAGVDRSTDTGPALASLAPATRRSTPTLNLELDCQTESDLSCRSQVAPVEEPRADGGL